MELTIHWTDFSKTELKKIFNYYAKNVNERVAEKVVDELSDKPNILKTLPEIGQKEIYLENRKHDFRYLIYTNYKIIYWINTNEKRIEIVDIFPTRQDPIKMKRIR